MADSYVTYTGPGPWSVPFPYIDQSHVHLYVDGVEKTTGVSWPTTGTLTLSPDPASDAAIFIQRETPPDPLVSFSNRVAVNESNLNLSALQTLYISIEAKERAARSIVKTTESTFDFDSARAINAADPIDDQDLVTKKWAEDSLTTDLAAVIAAKTAAEAAQAAAEAAVVDAEAASSEVEDKYFEFSPLHPDFGAKGDGTTDDSDAINAALTAARATRDLDTDTYRAIIDLGGRRYRCNSSIDVGEFRAAYGVVFKNGTILSHATGKVAVDASASRGIHFDNILIVGDPTDCPSTGLLLSRYQTDTGAEPGASEHILTNVRVTGEFTFTAIDKYGSETNGWYNVNAENARRSTDAFAYVERGIDTDITQSSEFRTLADGTVSNIMTATYGLKAQRSNQGFTGTVTSITLGTTTVIGYDAPTDPEEGYALSFEQIAGTVELNGGSYTPTAIDTVNKTITLDVDSSAWTAYESGGNIVYQTGPAMLIMQGQRIVHKNLYCVSNGYAPVVIRPSGSGDDIRLLHLEGHFEGIYEHVIQFDQGSDELAINDFKLVDHNNQVIKALFNCTGTGIIKLDKAEISILNFRDPVSVGLCENSMAPKLQFGAASTIYMGEGAEFLPDQWERLLNPPGTVNFRDQANKLMKFDGTLSPGHLEARLSCGGLFPVVNGSAQTAYRGDYLLRTGAATTTGPSIYPNEDGSGAGGITMAPNGGAGVVNYATQIRGPQYFKPNKGGMALVFNGQYGSGSVSNQRRVFGFTNYGTPSVAALGTADMVCSLDASGVATVTQGDACGIIQDNTYTGSSNWFAFSRKASGDPVLVDLGIAPAVDVEEYWRIAVSSGGIVYIFHSLDNVTWTLLATMASAISANVFYAPFATGQVTSNTSRLYYLHNMLARGHKAGDDE